MSLLREVIIEGIAFFLSSISCFLCSVPYLLLLLLVLSILALYNPRLFRKTKPNKTKPKKKKKTATDHNRHKGDIFFVFEFAEYDLAGIINNDSGFRFTPLQIKSIMHQMLRGIFYSHQRNIIHRDIKSPNILLTKDGLIKIADWGLAKFLNSAIDRRHTNRVVTLWYRAPELLLGASTRAQGYGSQMDIWSLG